MLAASTSPAALAQLMTETAANLRKGVVSTVARMLPATERRAVVEQWAAEGDPAVVKVKEAETQIRTVNVSMNMVVGGGEIVRQSRYAGGERVSRDQSVDYMITLVSFFYKLYHG